MSDQFFAPARRHSFAIGNVAVAIGMSVLGTVTAVAPGVAGAIAPAQPTQSKPTPSNLSPASPSPASPSPASPPSEGQATPFMQRLQTMFSPEIRNTLNVCQENGGVDLASNKDGQVVCGDGSAATVSYTNYLSTLSDLMAASTLLGIRVAFLSDQRIKPEMVPQLLSDPQSAAPLRSALTGALGKVGLLSPQSPTSPDLLVDEVMKRLLPTVQSTNNLTTLLGTPEQYNQVVNQFCKSPGTSLEQIQKTVAGMASPQIYAVCLQEAGLADELQRTLH